MIWLQLTFDMVTDPSTTVNDVYGTTFSVGSFTGLMGFYTCAPDVMTQNDCGVPLDLTLRFNPTLNQNCGDELSSLCLYSLSGLAEGYTSTLSNGTYPVPTNFNFAGTATLVPEPSSSIMIGTGLIGIVGVFRADFDHDCLLSSRSRSSE